LGGGIFTRKHTQAHYTTMIGLDTHTDRGNTQIVKGSIGSTMKLFELEIQLAVQFNAGEHERQLR
jgi:hypothetical protein